MLIYFLYSLGLSGLWYFLVQDIGYLGYWGLGLALVLSFYSPFWLRFLQAEETKVLQLIKLGLPLCLVVYGLLTQSEGLSFYDFFHPLVWALLLSALSLTNRQTWPPLHYQFFALFFCCFYPLKAYKEAWLKPKLKGIVLPLQVHAAKAVEPVDTATLASFKLADFAFINRERDTVVLAHPGKFTIIETWNEKCPPCMKAIPELSPFYAQHKDKASQYYLYIPNHSKSSVLDTSQVFNFDKIEDKSKILLDQDLQARFGFDSYPVFLIFDSSGSLVYQQVGYDKAIIIKDMAAILGG